MSDVTLDITPPSISIAPGSGTVSTRVPVKFKLLRPSAQVPEYKSAGAAGLDCYANFKDALGARWVLSAGITHAVPLGFAVAIPPGYEGQLRLRSGLAAKTTLSLANGVGTIDSDYRGEVQALVRCSEVTVLEHGMRLCQLIIAPIPRIDVTLVNDLEDTVRGSGGFGSTGI